MHFNVLTRPGAKLLHRLDQEAGAARDTLLRWEAAEPGRRVVRVVRGGKATSTAAFFDEAAAALQLPLYFGANWDAFFDCLADLAWLRGDAVVVLIVQAERLLELAPADELAKCLQTFIEAGAHLAQHARALHVVAQTMAADSLARRWQLAGQSPLDAL
jgi:RNAse (barnase) inhibitor barstar